MSMSVTNQASSYYSSYTFLSSEECTENAVDEAEVSEDSYNISSLTNALDTLEISSSTDISGIGNLNSYAEGLYKLSQLGVYSTLSSASEDAGISDLLTNTSSASDLIELSTTSSTLSEAYITYTSEATTSSLNDYESGLSSSTSGSLLDTSV